MSTARRIMSIALAAAALAVLGLPAVAPGTPADISISASQTAARTVAFDGAATGATAFSWDFGDGATSGEQSPTHVYAAPGDYTVSLTASDGTPPYATTTRQVHVIGVPTAAFGVAQAAGTLNVTFTNASTGEPTSFSWDFGDDSQSAQTSPRHAFSDPGTYTVTLTARNAFGSDTVSDAVTVSPPLPSAPRTSFTHADGAGAHAVVFTDTSTGSPTSWGWNFGDGPADAIQAPGADPVHAYSGPGSYKVTLTTCNAGGCDATTQTVDAPNAAPAAGFTVASNPASAGTAVGFDASTSTDPDLDPLTYAWDLDDDGKFDDGSGVTARMTFRTAGAFTVRLRVSDGASTATRTATVTVKDDLPPVAGFTFAPGSPRTGTTIVFTSTSTDPDGVISKLEWDLDGDGAFDDAAGTVAQWTFLAPGSHTVRLRATDDDRVSTVAFQTVIVAAPPPPPPSPSAPQAPPSAPSPSPARPQLLSPFPVVRIRGRILGAIVQLDLLSVRAPKGATVRVRCRGGGCGVRLLTRHVRSTRRAVRFRRMERRMRAGAVIEVFVIGRQSIGKYTRFVIRAGKAPGRRDLCLPPGSMRAERCPTQ